MKCFKFILLVFLTTFLYNCKSNQKQFKSGRTSTKKTHQTKTTNTAHPKETKTNSKVEKVINTARSYTGVKYKYGGSDKGGMDCSGLVCTAYNSVGITLPRNSTAQSNIGKRIYIGELLPGDLVFFATGSSKTKITHVGIITEVKSNSDVLFIHASTSKGVREDNVHDSYWRPRYIKAVRLTP